MKLPKLIKTLKLSNLYLFYISQIITSFYFWLAISIPYFGYRGLSSAEALGLLSIYNLLGVVFEYPTGIVGDKFGYKKMLMLSNFMTCAAMIILASNGGYWTYFVGLVVLAIGSGFLSGNDVGLLKSLSANIKKDTANYNSNTDFVLFLSSVFAGILASISFELTLYFGAFLVLIANIPMYFVKSDAKDRSILSYKQIFTGSIKAFSNKKLVLLFIFTSVLGGFIFTIKSIFGSMGAYFNMDIALIGTVVGLGGLARSIAARLYIRKLQENIAFPAILIPVLTLLVAIYPRAFTVVFALLSIHFIFGYVTPKIDADLHKIAHDNFRASLFSLRRLAMRIIASVFLMFYGILLNASSFSMIFYSLTAIFLISIIVSWKFLANRFAEVEIGDYSQKD